MFKIVGIAIFLAVVFAGYFVSNHQSTNEPSQSSSPEPTSDSYKNFKMN